MTKTEQSQLDKLIAEGRVVYLDSDREIERAQANEGNSLNLETNEVFHLAKSHYDGYYYIVDQNGCRCRHAQHHYTCKHQTAVSAFVKANLNKQDWIVTDPNAGEISEEAAKVIFGVFGEDLQQHLEDSRPVTTSCTCSGCCQVAQVGTFHTCGTLNVA